MATKCAEFFLYLIEGGVIHRLSREVKVYFVGAIFLDVAKLIVDVAHVDIACIEDAHDA